MRHYLVNRFQKTTLFQLSCPQAKGTQGTAHKQKYQVSTLPKLLAQVKEKNVPRRYCNIYRILMSFNKKLVK